MTKPLTREELERVARVYKTTRDAAAALDINPRSLTRLCRQYDIETPNARRLRRNKEARKH